MRRNTLSLLGPAGCGPIPHSLEGDPDENAQIHILEGWQFPDRLSQRLPRLCNPGHDQGGARREPQGLVDRPGVGRGSLYSSGRRIIGRLNETPRPDPDSGANGLRFGPQWRSARLVHEPADEAISARASSCRDQREPGAVNRQEAERRLTKAWQASAPLPNLRWLALSWRLCNLPVDDCARPRPDVMGYLPGLLAGDYFNIGVIVTKNHRIRTELLQLSRGNGWRDIGVA